MRTAVFVCPLFSPAARQMIDAAASLDGVRLAVVSQERLEVLPPALAQRIAAHWRIDDVTDPDALLHAVAALRVRLGTLDRVFGAYEQAQDAVAHVREHFDLPGLRPAAVRNFRDKARMKDVLRAAGIPVARHALAHTAPDVWRFAEATGFPLVSKPPAGAGARDTVRLDDAAQLAAWLEKHPPREAAPLLLEEFLQGTEHSCESATIDGTTVWQSVSHYDPTPLEVLRTPWIQWCVLLPREENAPADDDARDAVKRALTALGMTTGVSHTEWFRRTDGSIAISEIAARPPGAQFTTMLSRAHDHDFVQEWARLQLFGTFAMPPRRHAVGAAFLRGQGEGAVRAVEGLDAVRDALGDLVCDYRLPTRGQRPTGSYEGEGYIVLRHAETTTVRAALRRVISSVRVVLG